MAFQSPLAQYKKVQVTTSSPGELLMMLFDGLFRFMTEAEVAMRAGDRARTGERLGRAHAILEELTATLDNSASPELCDNLRGLYTFSMSHLVQANIKWEPAAIVEVMRILAPLRDGFRSAVRTAPKK